MQRRIRPAVIAAVWCVVLGSVSVAHAADMATVKALYASASYEEALAQLKALDPNTDQDEVQQYQAFCLIGLGRTSEAEEVLETLLTRNPRFSVAERDLSPKFLTLFNSVRVRTLPTVARGLYTQAKRSFDRRDFADALERFDTLLTVVKADRDASEDLEALTQLAEGFQQLAAASVREAQAKADAAAPAKPPVLEPAATTAPQVPAVAPPATEAASRVFTRDDADVRPPSPISRSIPPAPASLAGRKLSGLLVLVINEDGTVESAVLAQPMSPLYDQELIAAARRWRFRPATRGGAPVSYRLSFPLIVG